MFEWLENTPVAIWVGESLWAYPFWLALHVVGLAIVVGIFSMRDLRLLGLFKGLAPSAFLSLGKFAWAGFVVNAISGGFLFTSQAVTFVGSIPFLLKISFVAAGMTVAAIIQSRLRNELSGADGNVQVVRSTKLIAGISLLLWMSAIVTGRLIAYI